MNRSPYKVEFKYPVGAKERLLFEEVIKQQPIKLNFQWSITAGAQIQKSNTSRITLQESNNIKLSEKLFGPASEAYVTRDQMTELSNEVYSYFNVVETYEMPQDQFSSAFVENMISIAGQTSFKPVSFDDACTGIIAFKKTLNFKRIKNVY
jgi:hypothetical protein